MNTIILNGLNPARSESEKRFGEILAGKMEERQRHVQTFDLAARKIAPCRGCFSCWTKTPGRCVISDDQEEILRALASADEIVLLTPVLFGGYGPELKKALDRMIPVLLPFFHKVQGEIHHPQRYPRTRRLGVAGFSETKDADEIEIFRNLANRNAINWAATTTAVTVLHGSEDKESLAAASVRLIDELEVIS